jgi:nitroreductase
MGLGGCFMGSIDREKIAQFIGLSSEYKVVYVLALGYPKEQIVIDDISADGDIKYYRDENEVHHVPKKVLEDILL